MIKICIDGIDDYLTIVRIAFNGALFRWLGRRSERRRHREELRRRRRRQRHNEDADNREEGRGEELHGYSDIDSRCIYGYGMTERVSMNIYCSLCSLPYHNGGRRHARS